MTGRIRVATRRVLRLAAPSQWAARSVVLLAPFVVVLAGVIAGADLRTWFLPLVLVAAGVAAARPDTHAVGATMVVLLVFWWWSGPASSDAPVLLAAAGLVALHVAGTLAGYAPATAALDADLVRRWLLRGGLLWLVAVVAWASRRLVAPTPFDAVLGLVVVAGVSAWALQRYGRAARPLGGG